MSVVQTDPSQKASIFLSYSRVDKDQVAPVFAALEKRGHTVWWDGLLEGGDRFSQVTEDALETSDVVLVMWTKTSVNSDWVRDEATRGRDRKCMLSVSLDGTQPPLGFRQIQYIDLSGTGNPAKRARFADVTSALDKVADKFAEGNGGWDGVGAASFASLGAASPSGQSRRAALLLGGGGVLAVGAGLAAWQAGLLGGLARQAGQPGSIAVMTFDNLSEGGDKDYISSGLSEELRAILSRNRQLSVAAQTSSDTFDTGEQTASAIAAALDVEHVLEGSVRREGDALRVAARLIDGQTDLDVWSDVFTGQIDNVLSVQQDIATLVVDSLLASLSANEVDGTTRIGGTMDPAALDEYLRAVDLHGRANSDEETDIEALAALDRAIEIDPEYAAAYAARCRVLITIGNRYAAADELSSYYDNAMQAAQRSVEIEPNLAEGHSALGAILVNGKLDIASARQPYQRSIELGYGNARIMSGYTLFASYTGDFEGGRSAIKRAERLDPLNGSVFRAEAVLEFAARDYDAAARAARRAISLNDKISVANRILGDIARFEGRFDEARAFFEIEPSTLSRQPSLAMLEAQVGNRAAAEKAFADMVNQFGDNSLYQQAQVYAQWGNIDQALNTLERAYDVGDAGLVLSRSDQNLDRVRQEPAFTAMQQKLGFE